MAYGITRESQLIDVVHIQRGCEILESAAEDFRKCGNAVVAAADTCDKNAMSFDGKTMAPTIEQLGNDITKIEQMILNITNEIRIGSQMIYNAQKRELDSYLRNANNQNSK